METAFYQVVIVGAGPTGLALGAELLRLGIKPLILDKIPAGANTSRAAVIHARTLEVLEPLNINTQLIQAGIPTENFTVRKKDKTLATISFKDLPTKYPFALMCPQNRTEEILLQRLEELGGKVQRPCEVVAIQAGLNEVQIEYTCGTEKHQVRTAWLIGCDGMHSLVREQAGIAFVGDSYQESFILADVEMDNPLGQQDVSLFLDKQGLMMIGALPQNHYRLIATVKEAPAAPTAADFQTILDERGLSRKRLIIRNMSWSSRFHIHHRIAQNLLKGRILIAGDAAHVHSPAGGQGMNTGIQDAISLADALYQTLHQHNKMALQQWEEKRLAIAHKVVKMTDRLTKAATTSSPLIRSLRNGMLSLVARFPAVRTAIARDLAELDNK